MLFENWGIRRSEIPRRRGIVLLDIAFFHTWMQWAWSVFQKYIMFFDTIHWFHLQYGFNKSSAEWTIIHKTFGLNLHGCINLSYWIAIGSQQSRRGYRDSCFAIQLSQNAPFPGLRKVRTNGLRKIYNCFTINLSEISFDSSICAILWSAL